MSFIRLLINTFTLIYIIKSIITDDWDLTYVLNLGASCKYSKCMVLYHDNHADRSGEQYSHVDNHQLILTFLGFSQMTYNYKIITRQNMRI